MQKVKITVSVTKGNTTRQEKLETQVDSDTLRELSYNKKPELEKAWCQTFFPLADSIRITAWSKIN